MKQRLAYAITPETEHHLVDNGEVRQFTVSAVFHFLLMYSQIYLLLLLPENLYSCRFWINIHIVEKNAFWPVPNNYYGDNYSRITLCFTSWAYCTFSPTAAPLVGCLKNTESETKSKKVRERENGNEWMNRCTAKKNEKLRRSEK